MSDDDLRARLALLDPAPAGVPVDPASSPRAADLLESTMQTVELDTPSVDVPARPRWRRPALAAAAVVAAVALGVGALQLGGDDEPAVKAPPTTLALSVPAAAGGGPSMGSCIMFDVQILRGMPLALAGTVVAQDADSVTLKVDHWYKGGTADQVRIARPAGETSVALEGGVAFEQGQRYLLTATDGTVNGCGYSGAATPELEKSYAEAFGS
jgi:hypothetical protein